MAKRRRPWSAVAVALAGLAGVLAVSGFGAQRSSASGDAGPLAAPRAGAAAAPGGWGKAITLPGQVFSPSAISCSSAGNCSAVGLAARGYVVSQVRGKWGSPTVIPGIARTRQPTVSPDGIACFSRGCIVVGSYVDSARHLQAFIISQSRGTWGKPLWVPGLAQLDRGHSAGLGELWCSSAGNCTAAGSYTDAAGTGHPFDVAQVHGIWGRAIPMPDATGLPGQTTGTTASFGPISCSTPGNCSAAGSYPANVGPLGNRGNQLFVISQVNGVWGSAIPMPGMAALNTGVEASIYSTACASPGNCSAGGFYWTSNQFQDAFVINQVNGTWRPAIEVPGTARLGTGAWISTISCPSPGNCGAGGVYNAEDSERPFSSVFVINEVNGHWNRALPVPGSSALNQGDYASVSVISCPTAGNCGAGGYYTPGDSEQLPFWDAFVVTEVHGIWGRATIVPGTGVENTGVNANITAISCTAPVLSCAAGGQLLNNKTGTHAFVVSKP